MFNILTAKDFYAIVVQDFEDFVAEPSSARRAMHCAITSYHLHEWVWAEISKDKSLLSNMGISKRDKDEFLAWIDKACPWFGGVQFLANGSKHMRWNESVRTLRVEGFGSGPFGVGPFGRSYLLIDFGEDAAEHRWMPAQTLLEIIVRFWRDFFKKYMPAPDLPESKHHCC